MTKGTKWLRIREQSIHPGKVCVAAMVFASVSLDMGHMIAPVAAPASCRTPHQ